MPNLSATHPLAELLRQRGLTLSGWARTHDYNPRTVQVTAKRWAHRSDRTPHGGLARDIMAKLIADLTGCRTCGIGAAPQSRTQDDSAAPLLSKQKQDVGHV